MSRPPCEFSTQGSVGCVELIAAVEACKLKAPRRKGVGGSAGGGAEERGGRGAKEVAERCGSYVADSTSQGGTSWHSAGGGNLRDSDVEAQWPGTLDAALAVTRSAGLSCSPNLTQTTTDRLEVSCRDALSGGVLYQEDFRATAATARNFDVRMREEPFAEDVLPSLLIVSPIEDN
jgi:hypothetical protein